MTDAHERELLEEARLRQLAQTLDALGPAEAPEDLVREVMRQVAESDRQSAIPVTRHDSLRERVRRVVWPEAGSLKRGLLWGSAAASVAAILVVRWLGSPIPDNTRATVGVTQVAADDRAARDFLQGDTLAQIRADAELRGLLACEPFTEALANLAFREALAEPGIAEALAEAAAEGSMRVLLARPNMRAALEDSTVSRALSSTDLRARLQTAGARAALANPLLEAALTHPGFAGALASGQLRAALAGAPQPAR